MNSRECQFSDISVSLLGKTLTGLRGITYDMEEEAEHLYAQGKMPNSIQTGNVKPTGTLTLLQGEFEELDKHCRDAGYNRGLLGVPYKLVNITIVYQKDDGDPLSTDTLLGVKFTKKGKGMKSGDKFKEVELPFLYMDEKPAP